MKKIISCLLVSLLVLNGIIPGVNAYASTGEINYEYNLDYLEVLEEEILEEFEEFEEELVQEYGFEILEDMDVDISISEEEFIVEIDFEEEDFIASLEIAMKLETEDVTVISEVIDSTGELILQEVEVFIHDADEDVFIATLIDLETGESYEINTTELQASVLAAPIVLIITKFGVKAAIKMLGKKAIQGVITGYTKHGLAQAMGRNGGRGVATWAINNAIKNPTKIVSQANGVLRYENIEAVVVLNKYGKVITTWAKTSRAWR